MNAAAQIVRRLLEDESPEDFIDRHEMPLAKALEPWNAKVRELRSLGLRAAVTEDGFLRVMNPRTEHYLDIPMDGDPGDEDVVDVSSVEQFERIWWLAIGQNMEPEPD